MTKVLAAAAPAGQCLRVIVACAFVSALGLIVTNPFKEAVGIGSNCLEEQTPATLVVNSQISPACIIALSASE